MQYNSVITCNDFVKKKKKNSIAMQSSIIKTITHNNITHTMNTL